VLCGTPSVTPRKAWFSLNHAFRFWTSIFIVWRRTGSA
jgi:hypothetical protein